MISQPIPANAGTYDFPPNGPEPEPGWHLIFWGLLSTILLMVYRH